MKAILTLILILFFGALAAAQNTPVNQKAQASEQGIIRVENHLKAGVFQNITGEDSTKVARLYRLKFSKINKELSFSTKRNKAKLA